MPTTHKNESYTSKNELLVEGEFDSQTALLFEKTAIEEAAKLYGPIYTRLASRYALDFEADKLNEKPPENIQELGEAINYIIANLDRYPRGYCSPVYGVAKAESELQGSTGSGYKRVAYGAMKSIIASSGMLNSLIGTTEDAFEACKKFSSIVKSIKVVIPMRLTPEENNQVTAVYPDCWFKEACSALVKEGVSRMIGGLECEALMLLNVGVELITKKTFDYRLDEFDAPQCKGRVWEI